MLDNNNAKKMQREILRNIFDIIDWGTDSTLETCHRFYDPLASDYIEFNYGYPFRRDDNGAVCSSIKITFPNKKSYRKNYSAYSLQEVQLKLKHFIVRRFMDYYCANAYRNKNVDLGS